MAHDVLVTTGMNKHPNQGEGDRKSARRYDRHLQEYIAEGKVDDAAQIARNFVELHPLEAERAEREARNPKAFATAEQLVATGRTFIERIRQAAARLRARVTKR
jgi:hypothetical protein